MAKTLKVNELKTFEQLVTLRQPVLFKAMKTFLKSRYNKVIVTKDYIYAIGDIPIALVAHLDTVFVDPVENLYYDERKNVLWSPEGLGADDRAGVFLILQIIKSGLRPSVIFTTDEEKGGLGAIQFAIDIPKPATDIKYLIELDRQGTNDCVFYDCDNLAFSEYVESFGFVETFGSFSDISMICPQWGIAGVNLSVGYFNEHSVSETLHVNALLSTLKKVMTMLKETNIPNFKYIPTKYSYKSWFSKGSDWYKNNYDEMTVVCKKCGLPFSEYEVFPVKTITGGTAFYCPDCIAVDNVKWCDRCQEAFESRPEDPDSSLCDDCKKEISGGQTECNSKKKNNSL